MNFHTCIVRMRHGVYASFNKISLTAQLGVLVELQRWLTSLLGWNNTLVTATQGCMDTIKGHKADGRLSGRIARACAGASWSFRIKLTELQTKITCR